MLITEELRGSRFLAKDWVQDDEEDEREYFGSDLNYLRDMRGQWQSSITLLGSQSSLFQPAWSTSDLNGSSSRNKEYAWTWEVDAERMKANTAGCVGSKSSSMVGRGDPKSWTLLSDNQQGTAAWAERVIRSYCELSNGSLLTSLTSSPTTPCMQSTKLIIAQQLSVSSLTDGQFQAPSSHSASVPLIVNQCQLLQFLDLVWRALQLSLPQFPTELMLLFGSLRACLEPIRGAEFCDILISSCLFLRLICPAILAPSLFHLLPSYPSEVHIQRNLTLLAKALQTLANFTVLSDKEPFMRYLRAYIECQIPKMRSFIRLISSSTSSASISQSYSTTSTTHSSATSSSSHSHKSNPKTTPVAPKPKPERGSHVDQIDTGFHMALVHSQLCHVFFSENNNLQLPKELMTLPQLLGEVRVKVNPDVKANAKLMEESWLHSNENAGKNCTGLLKGESADEIFLVARAGGGSVKTSNSFNGLENFKRTDSSSQIYAVPNTIHETADLGAGEEVLTGSRESHIYDVPYLGLVQHDRSSNSHHFLPDHQTDSLLEEIPIYDTVPCVEVKKAPSEPVSKGAVYSSRKNQAGTAYKRQSPVKLNSHRRMSSQGVPVPGSYLPINVNKRVASSANQYSATNAAKANATRLPMLTVKPSTRPYSSACFPSSTEAVNNSSSPSQRSSVVPSPGMNLSMLLSTPGVCSSSQSDLSAASSLSLMGAADCPKATPSPNRMVSTVVIRQLNKNGPDSEELDRRPRLSIPGPPPLTASIENELPHISQFSKDSSNFQTLEQALAW
ncbi:Ras GTPase-activating protein nGAP [Cichlidogyrus casuarinus]|uniref:Ras GTPase-activating protein nGAP n=1 Tax=Cichlidogyrus casuarinus TaxID=1844966 RepID=A0ABD2PTS9_9PLAT